MMDCRRHIYTKSAMSSPCRKSPHPCRRTSVAFSKTKTPDDSPQDFLSSRQESEARFRPMRLDPLPSHPSAIVKVQRKRGSLAPNLSSRRTGYSPYGRNLLCISVQNAVFPAPSNNRKPVQNRKGSDIDSGDKGKSDTEEIRTDFDLAGKERKYNNPYVDETDNPSPNEAPILTEIFTQMSSGLRQTSSIQIEDELIRTNSVSKYHEFKFQLMTEDSLRQVRTKQGVQGSLLRWKAGDTVGQGGMGQVLKAFNTRTGEIFAVKRLIFNQENAVQNEFVKTLETEITILSKLDHPNIVKYLGSERVSDSLCTYLEYVSGGSLSRIVSQFGPLTEAVVQIYLKQVVEGLVYLHSKGVVHRDLKCANILVDGEGLIKLSDFGSSSKSDSSQQSSLLTSLKGSLLWMAPEVMRQSGYGRKADVWSLGCTAIEMVSGKPPWPGCEDVMQAIIRIGLSNDVPEIPTNVSDQAQNFISLCIKRDPKLRPTAIQLLQHPFLQRSV